MDRRENYKKTTLRLPVELYDRIEASIAGKKSVNAAIVETLEEAFPVLRTDQIINTIGPILEQMIEDGSPGSEQAFALLSELHAELGNRSKR